jgi:hydroxymethylglutaryl-CoA reductase
VDWLHGRRAVIEAHVRQVSRHARLVAVEPYQIGRYVHVRYVHETADAGGQNMTTAATDAICRWVNAALADEPGLRPVMFMIEGNMSGDKKVGQLSLLAGRGTRATAECFLDRATVASVLKTSPEALERGQRLSIMGGQQSGMVGYNVNVANIVAAIFVATGQDVACVHESSTAIFALEATGEGLRATMLLPGLVVGTVGGGTGLPRQRDFLAALGCAGEARGPRLAEIIAGFMLALDLSTAAAVAGGQSPTRTGGWVGRGGSTGCARRTWTWRSCSRC